MSQVLSAWQRFLDGLPVDASLPEVILDSWARSRDAGVEPRPEAVAFRRVGAAELEARLAENEGLLRAARAHLAWLTPFLSGVRHVLYLVDADGVVLYSIGDREILESCGLHPGYDWSEAAMGTNGAGTALASGHPVAIVGPMHFCAAWHDATCVAAPVRAPDGRIIGAIDLTTTVADGNPERLLLVAHLAFAIEQTLAQEQARRQIERLQRLSEASVTINGTLSLEAVLQLITDQAREIIGAHMAVTAQTVDSSSAEPVQAVSLSDKYAAWRGDAARPDGNGIPSLVCRPKRPIRLSQAELEMHPAWRGAGREAGAHPPFRGWLAAPLVGRDGRNLGVIQVSDRYEGDFTAEDEAVLVRLAALAAAAIENARLYREATEAVRLRDRFLARASHELRTPLTSLVGMIRMLERALAGTLAQPPGALVQIARRNVDGLLALVNNLLDASRLAETDGVDARAPVELRDVVIRSLDVVAPQARELGVSVRTNVPSGLVLDADAPRLEQVFVNLLANAVKFTGEGREITVGAEASDGPVVVRVRDTGRGIAAEHLERIFEPFFQASPYGRPRDRGTGLGLAICRQIVTAHGGRIWAESDGPGRGATFVVQLPSGEQGRRVA